MLPMNTVVGCATGRSMPDRLSPTMLPIMPGGIMGGIIGGGRMGMPMGGGIMGGKPYGGMPIGIGGIPNGGGLVGGVYDIAHNLYLSCFLGCVSV